MESIEVEVPWETKSRPPCCGWDTESQAGFVASPLSYFTIETTLKIRFSSFHSKFFLPYSTLSSLKYYILEEKNEIRGFPM